MTFRLFISHSSHEAASRERLTALVAAITAEGGGKIKVLYDKGQIVGGDEWRRRIAYLLHACDAAVVLLDQPAFESSWVLAESIFLSIRQTVEPDFRLVPVSFLDRDELTASRSTVDAEREQRCESSWRPVQLHDLQYVKGRSVEIVAHGVVEALRSQGQLDPHDNVVEKLADQLVPLLRDAPPARLRQLAEELGDDVPYLTIDEHKRGALAIARQMICEGSLSKARQQLDGLGTQFLAAHGLDIFESLAPLPFDAEAAILLRRERTAGAYTHAWLQTGSADFSAPLYLRRAHLPSDPGPFLMVVTRHATAESVRAEIRDEYRQKLAARLASRGPARRRLSDADVDARLRDIRNMRVCINALDGKVLQDLAADYPNVAFVMCHEPDDITTPPPGVQRVLPALDQKRELQILMEYDNAFI